MIIFLLAAFFPNLDLKNNLNIPLGAAILAGLSILVSGLMLFKLPHKYLSLISSIAYSLLMAALSIAVITSPNSIIFVSLWSIGAIFAALFGNGFAILIIIASYIILTREDPAILSFDRYVTVLFISIVPALTGMFIWNRRQSAADIDPEERMYKELTSELNQVSTKAEVVINAIDDGVIALDKQGVIVLINPAAQRIMGWGQQDALNLDYKSVFKLVDSQNHPVKATLNPVEKSLRSNKPIFTDTLSLETNSGKHIAVSVSVSPVGKTGEGCIVVFRDVTSSKAEEREQAEFISTASHEMRTPVASIEGYLGLVLNPQITTIDDKARDYITKAHESARHLGRLFQDLLDVSKADDGRMTMNPQPIDTAFYLKDIVLGLKPQADEKGLQLIYKPAEKENTVGQKTLHPLMYIKADPDHVREVVSNLVENGIKYTSAGSVTVDIITAGDRVTISVADTGIGIPKEDQAHLFQKFYRIDNSDTREIGGTGLGLYLSRRLTEQMGGKIWVESDHQKGSTFFVEFPKLDEKEADKLIEQQKAQAV